MPCTGEEWTIEEKRSHNLKAPIFRLPPEILSTIFLCVRDDIANIPALDVSTYVPDYNLNHWIGLSQVCHMWRQAALNTATLWTQLILSRFSKSQAKKLLCRSKQCALHVLLVGTRPSVQKALEGHLDRCWKLSLHDTAPDVVLDILSKVDHSRLEYLFLRGGGLRNRHSLFILNDSNLQTTSLRHLGLLGYGVDLNSTLLQFVTHLKLIKIPSIARPTLRDLVAFLSGMPGLEVLHLVEFLKNDDIEGDSESHLLAERKIPLLCLKSLTLGCMEYPMAILLSHTIIHSTCRLFLECQWGEAEPTTNFQVILSYLSNHLNTSQFPGGVIPQPHLLRLHLNYNLFDYKLEGFRDVDGDVEFSFGMEVSEEDDPLKDNTLGILLSSLSLGHVAFLEIVGLGDYSRFPQHIFVEIFGSLPSLQTFVINSDYTDFGHIGPTNSFFQSLVRPSRFFNAPSHPFPALSSIILKMYPDPNYDLLFGFLWDWAKSHRPLITELTLNVSGEVPQSFKEDCRQIGCFVKWVPNKHEH